jgi:acyl-CoA synthetase (NDP forming)
MQQMTLSQEPPTLGARPVASLFTPRSAVVIGASSDPSKWGGLVAEKLLRGVDRRAVYLVNRSGAEILGHRSYRSMADLPERPEFAAITVPQSGFAAAVDDALGSGVKAIVGMTSGFAETGREGAALQAEIVERVRAAGSVLLGPNCMGVYDSAAGFDCLPWAEPPAGSLGIISQSGSLIMDVARRAQVYGLGVSRAASIGNQADVTIADLVTSFAEHELTDVIAVYCEDVGDGRALFEAVHQSVSQGTPVVILAPAAVDSARRAARSHTGAMLSDRRVIEAACQASGAVLVDSIRALVEATHAVRSPLRGRGRRTAVVSDAGGLTVLGAGAATAAGLDVPLFSDVLEDELSHLSLPGTGLKNPVDIVGLVKVDEFVPVLELILRSPEVDGVLATVSVFNSDDADAERAMGDRLARAALASGKPLALATPDLDNRGIDALRQAGVPVFADVEVAAHALTLLSSEDATGLPRQPEPRPLPSDAATYFGARRLLAEHGVPCVTAEEVGDRDQALAAAERIGYPVVLKALGTLHKSDAGGVALALSGPDALTASYEDMRARLQPASFSVERMVEQIDATELIVGGRNDTRFGPVVLVGVGGVFAEILADTAVALAPIDEDRAEQLVRELRAAPLLLGARGRRAADLAAFARAVGAISQVVASHPDLAELDVNPLVVSPSGAVALDARIVPKGES